MSPAPHGFDLEPGAEQLAIREALLGFCEDHLGGERADAPRAGDTSVRFDRALWRELAELGVLGLATPDGGGGALELVASMEALGRYAFPGPLGATFFATQVLPADARAAVATGERLVAVADGEVVAWAPLADLFLQIADGRAFAATAVGEIEELPTLACEPWGRVRLERGAELGAIVRASALRRIANAAYLVAAGQRLVDEAAEHARTRRQFGRPIGEFQAVSQPLAGVAIRLVASGSLARVAAFAFDRDAPDAAAQAATAELSARRAALDAVHVAHQLCGAAGLALEGPILHVTRQVRQRATPSVGDDAREVVFAIWEAA